MNTQLTKGALGGFDPAAAREYLQFGNVQRGVFALYEQLFSIKFVEHSSGSLPVWHESVRVFDFYDTAEVKEDKLLGRMYTDLHPRSGSYGHACVQQISLAEPGVALPECVLVCNFSPGEHALMTSDELRTMAHGISHGIHFLLGSANQGGLYRRFSSFSIELDMIETMSQMLEFWVKEPEILQRFALNKKNEVIPVEMVQSLAKMDDVGKAVTTRRQLFYAELSLGYYMLSMNDSGKYPQKDTNELYNDLLKRYCDFGEPDGVHFQLDFGHLAGGYDARYYGYQASLSLAFDLGQEFREKGWLDAKTAIKYRKSILEPGAAKDGAVMMEDFLGRPSSQEAYLKWLGKAL